MSPLDQGPEPDGRAQPDGGPRLHVRSGVGRWVIAATVLGSGMAAIDATVVGIALPTIGRDFHASIGALQWVVTGYTLTLSALLLLAGSLGDRFGRKRMFAIGVVWFTLASVACALTGGSAELIAARVLQGVGAALLTPGSLAILEASFAEGERSQAIGAWTGLGGIATAAGPLLGGYLIAAASWRWIFFINVPVGIAVLVLTARHVPETRDPAATGRLDVGGAVLGIVSLAGISAALIEGPEVGWTSVPVLATLVVGVVGAVAFVAVERATPAPMLPISLFKNVQFSTVNGVTGIVYAALGGALFLLPVELQVVNGYSPLESGLALLPVTVVMLALSARSGRLAARIGPRLQMSVGPVIVGAGLALLARATTEHNYVTGVLPGVLVFALGLAATVAPLTATALSAAPAERAGLASATNNAVARTGSLIAVAVLPALAGLTGDSYLHPAALAAGFRTAMYIAAGACAVGGVVACCGIRNRPRRAAGPAAQPPARVCCPLDATPLASE